MEHLKTVKFTHVLALSVAFRTLLIVYGEFHDAHSTLKYTDIDYRVFSDAAHFITHPTTEDQYAKGPMSKSFRVGDPYNRATYRYTPLLALLLVFNEIVHNVAGKLIFSLADILIGILLKRISQLSSSQFEREHQRPAVKTSGRMFPRLNRDEMIISAIWLLNPFPANISTRGSSESLLGLFVIGMLYCATRKRWTQCAVLLGLCIHWKIYPVIYMGSVIPLIGEDGPIADEVPKGSKLSKCLKWCMNPRRIQFIVTTAASFLALSVSVYAIWGAPFLHHSYLYHIGRTDHRHNFSSYFYPLYLGLTRSQEGSDTILPTKILSLASFIPQMTISIGGGLYLSWYILNSRKSAQRISDHLKDTKGPKPGETVHKGSKPLDQTLQHLPFILFFQTFTFVMLNKVCTSQYFMWYLWFLPLVIPRFRQTPGSEQGISTLRAAWMAILWVGSQALWLSYGYKLEFLGEQVFLELWVSGTVMLVVNAWILGTLLDRYRWTS
ncbi:hypothetical protein CPB86DRAFT_194739 [Serendipita vermifera]|nr:hypothetical protein CPB86DRAFT_194739 [Serendipita vermifera]